MSHTHHYVLFHATYGKHEIDEGVVYLRGVQKWRCECGEAETRIVTDIVPGTETQPTVSSPQPRM